MVARLALVRLDVDLQRRFPIFSFRECASLRYLNFSAGHGPNPSNPQSDQDYLNQQKMMRGYHNDTSRFLS
jgi:hypothetical protein